MLRIVAFESANAWGTLRKSPLIRITSTVSIAPSQLFAKLLFYGKYNKLHSEFLFYYTFKYNTLKYNKKLAKVEGMKYE